MGFEPMKNGFAIRSLSPLGHATGSFNPEPGLVRSGPEPHNPYIVSNSH
jgi:hypothetical protein